MTDLSSFWDRMAKGYVASPIADDESYKKKLEITQNLFSPDSRVLEIGCGSGATAVLHAPHVAHIEATDISENMLAFARQNAASAGVENINFVKAGAHELPYQPATFDFVLTLSILHLLDNKEAAIARVFELLKPGGYFISSTVCLNDSAPLVKYVAPLGRRIGLLPPLNFFSRDQLSQSILDAGFEITQNWLPGKGKSPFIVAKKPS